MNRISRILFITVIAMMSMMAINSVPVAAQDSSNEDVITVRYLVPQWASSTDRRAERQIAFQSVIDTFELRYPNIVLEEVIYDGTQVTAAQEIASGNADAIWIGYFWYPEWQAQGLFADLTPYMEDGVEDEYFDWTINFLRGVDGNLGALWHNTDTPIYFYRSDVLETPPSTWSELRAAAEAYSADNGGYLYTTPIQNWTQTNLGMYVALGGEVVDENGAPVLFNEGNRQILAEMFEFYAGLANDGLMPAEAAVNNHNSQMPLIYAGDVMSFAGNNNMHIRALQPNLPPEEYELWASAPLPRPDNADAGQYVAGGWVIALVADEDEAAQEAAANWVLHATDFNALRDTNKAGGWVPTRTAVIEQDPFYAEDPFMITTLNALNEGGYVRPSDPIIGVINTELSVVMSAVISGEATIDEALSAAEATIMSEYEALNN